MRNMSSQSAKVGITKTKRTAVGTRSYTDATKLR